MLFGHSLRPGFNSFRAIILWVLIVGLVTGRAEDPAPPKGYANAALLMGAVALKQVKLVDRNPSIPAGVKEEKDLVYGKVGDRSLLMDLYHQAGKTRPAPALLFIHGGGWKSGSREDYRVYTTHFASLGYVAASISYRLVPGAVFPAQVEDAKCAVRYLRENAARFGIDPDRIAVLGGSAGGHLALMLGYADKPEWDKSGGHAGVSSRVAAVVDFYGPVDFTTPAARTNSTVRSFIGKPFEEAEAAYREASPSIYLRAGGPPTLIFHGTIDDIVPVEQSDDLNARLEQLHVPHEYGRLTGWPHTMDAAEPVNLYCRRVMERFLSHHLKFEPAP